MKNMSNEHLFMALNLPQAAVFRIQNVEDRPAKKIYVSVVICATAEISEEAMADKGELGLLREIKKAGAELRKALRDEAAKYAREN